MARDRKKTKIPMILTLAAVLMMLLILGGCTPGGKDDGTGSGTPANPSETGQADKTDGGIIKLGVSHYGMQNEFTQLISAAQKEMARELGVEIDIYDANYDMSTQVSQFEDMIDEGYDAIIFSPVDVVAMSIAVNKAYEAGVPVIGVNTKVESDKLTSYVGSYDVDAGEIEMTYIAEKLGGKGNIVILEGPLGSSAQVQRREGIHNILRKYPDIHILSEKTANWSNSEGLALMELWLQAFPDQIDAVVGQNDEMALGAVEALEAAGLKDKIPVIGIDAISDALLAVKEGHLDATVFQDAAGQGRMSVQVAVDYLSGKTIELEYWIPFILVTPDNVDDYID